MNAMRVHYKMEPSGLSINDSSNFALIKVGIRSIAIFRVIFVNFVKISGKLS